MFLQLIPLYIEFGKPYLRPTRDLGQFLNCFLDCFLGECRRFRILIGMSILAIKIIRFLLTIN